MPSITEAIGRVLGGRYRLTRPLGTGASAFVYLADDVSLHRRVAVKVLHPALAEDQSFLKRFRAEARAVAALNHPNVLQVYDWGEDDHGPYLVLEYLDGGSLRQVLDTGTALSRSQAVDVARQAAAGLAYAHRRGFVHRDIKPGNLLFDSEQRLRIADFGLARALAEAAWTEPVGTVLGTARYVAPEQVLGQPVDGRADVYALALVVYEAVTGEVPFAGETTVETMHARVGALLPEHEALGPLYDTLVWAAAPEMEERLDAEEFGKRLAALSVDLPAPEPLPVVVAAAEAATPLASFEDLPDPEAPTAAIALRERLDTTEIGVPERRGSRSRSQGTRQARRLAAGGLPPGAGPEALEPEEPDRSEPPAPRVRRWPWVAAVAVLLAALLAGGGAIAVHDGLFATKYKVPSFVNASLTDAQALAKRDHLAVRVGSTPYSTTVAKGVVMAQSPDPTGKGGAGVAPGTVVALTVSAGLPPVTIPDVTKFSSCSDATAALAVVHLNGVCPTSAEQYSSSVPAGSIIGSSPSGTATYGSSVTIIISKGHAPVTVPNVAGTGTTYAGAVATLQAAGFAVQRIDEYSNTVPQGAVIGTNPSPSAGPQPYGTSVTVAVSLGPQPVTVPDVTGDSITKATSVLENAGLVVGGPYGPKGAKYVISESPSAGSTVTPGTTIDLYVG